MKLNRVDQLISSVLLLIRLRDKWVSSGIPRISNEFAQAMDDFVLLWDDGDIPADVRPLYDFYPILKEEWIQFGNYASERNPQPRAMFWNQVKNMEALLLTREEQWDAPILETVSELAECKPNSVSWRQICYIYSHKGEGPFMRNKQPQVRMAQEQYNYEKAAREAKTPEELERLLRLNRGKKHLPDNFQHPAITEREKAGSRVEKMLLERVNTLLKGFGGAMDVPESSILADDAINDDGLPKRRGELDGSQEFGELESTQPATTLDSEQAPMDELEAQLQRSEEATLMQQVFMLHDKNPNVSNKSISETLGIPVNKVKEWLRNRVKLEEELKTSGAGV